MHIATYLIALAITSGSYNDSTIVKNDTIREVVITAQSPRQQFESVLVGAEQLQLKDLNATPALFGENDIMRSIQLLAGVKSESEASSNFQVRGGTSAQNAVLYDDAPVFNVGHLGGLFSAFNDEALAMATLYKGLFPARYGGATSAVLDITPKVGNKYGWHGSATIGLLAAKASIEGPFAKDKGTLFVAARRSYIDLFMKMIPDFRDNILFFYDINAKLDYKLGRKNRIALTFFTGRDNMAVEDMVGMKWKNLTSTLKWIHNIKEASHSETSAFFSNYTTDNGIHLLDNNNTFEGYIQQLGLLHNTHFVFRRLTIDAGLKSTLMKVKSAEWQIINNHEIEKRNAWDNNLWINADIDFSKRIKFAAGARLNIFSALGGSLYYDINEQGEIIRLFDKSPTEIIKSYMTLEPRLSTSIMLSPSWILKAGYTRTTQNIHALRNQSLSTPFDRYALSSNLIQPEIADQLSMGIFAITANETFGASLEGYWRNINNVADYKDGKNFNSEIEIERIILSGKGRSYGLETTLRKNKGRLTGWMSYTLSWSKTKIEGINNGHWYNASNDRRHDINIVGIYDATKHWRLSAAWTYYSGMAFSAPYAKYEIIDNWIYYYAERNGYRAPAYHRLDLSATWSKRTNKTRTLRQWTFSIYNAYNRYNPFIIQFEDSSDGKNTTAKQYSLFGILPSVAYSIHF